MHRIWDKFLFLMYCLNFPFACTQVHVQRVKLSILNEKLKLFSYPSVLTFDLGDQKNSLIETVLFSSHNICFG